MCNRCVKIKVAAPTFCGRMHYKMMCSWGRWMFGVPGTFEGPFLDPYHLCSWKVVRTHLKTTGNAGNCGNRPSCIYFFKLSFVCFGMFLCNVSQWVLSWRKYRFSPTSTLWSFTVIIWIGSMRFFGNTHNPPCTKVSLGYSLAQTGFSNHRHSYPLSLKLEQTYSVLKVQLSNITRIVSLIQSHHIVLLRLKGNIFPDSRPSNFTAQHLSNSPAEGRCFCGVVLTLWRRTMSLDPPCSALSKSWGNNQSLGCLWSFSDADMLDLSPHPVFQ